MKRRLGDVLWKVGMTFVKWSSYLDPPSLDDEREATARIFHPEYFDPDFFVDYFEEESP